VSDFPQTINDDGTVEVMFAWENTANGLNKIAIKTNLNTIIPKIRRIYSQIMSCKITNIMLAITNLIKISHGMITFLKTSVILTHLVFINSIQDHVFIKWRII
jgi:hypothetical protein